MLRRSSLDFLCLCFVFVESESMTWESWVVIFVPMSIIDLNQFEFWQNTKHNVEKTNKCNQCHCTSSYASALKIHLMTHSGEKPNKCIQCDFACSDPSSLRTHMKRHSGEKSNKCNQCEYASSRASRLRTHLTTPVSYTHLTLPTKA